MSRKIILLISIILLLGLTGNVSAAMVGWWKFDGNANDSSGNGYNGTVTGASFISDGTRGNVLDFEGVDYVSIPSGALSTISSQVTVAAWFYGDAAFQPQVNNIFEGTRSGSRTLNAHIPWSNGNLVWDAGYSGTTYDRVSLYATNANQYEGQWNHWAFTKDTSSGQMKMYLNGTIWTSGTGKTRSMSGINLFKIGSAADGTANYDGMISDFRLYNTVLTETEVRVLAGWTRTISGTVGTLDGVKMSGLPGEPVTSGGGAYSATVDYGWSGTVTPTIEGYSFSPTNRTYSIVTSDQTAQNYTPTLLTYTISGTLGTLNGVTMNGLPGNPVTSGGGAYSATVNYGWDGTVTPTLAGYTFNPTYRTYSDVASNLTENYTPVINTYIIWGNAGTLGGVTMSGLPGNPVTSSGGAYSATVIYGWSGTVTPTREHFDFDPTSRTYSNVTADQDEQNYTVSTLLADVNLVGWWPFNGNANDYSGYGYNGTVTGAQYVTSEIGTVLDFDGSDYVSIPSGVFSSINDQVTIALWQYGDAAIQPQNDNIFEGTKSGNRTLSSHLPWGSGTIFFDAGYAGGSYDRINKAADSANQYEGQWNHWAFTKDLTTDQMKIYLNGQLWHSGTAKSKSMAGIDTFKIGSAANGTGNYDGMICEVRIYDRTMSDTEISDLYDASYEAIEPSPADGTVDVATSADLSWTAGYLAGEHDVYFGTNVTAVTNRDASVFKGTRAAATYDPGTLAAGVTYYWAVDEVNDYYENSPWLSDVWSFTTAGTAQTCPICGEDGLCDLIPTNYNTRLGRITGVQTVNIIRVTMDGRTTISLSSLQSNVNTLNNFYQNASYGRLGMSTQMAVTYDVPVAGLTTTRNRVIAYANTLPSAFLTYVQWPQGLASYSNAGSGRIYCNDGLDRTTIHETGHIIGLAHSNKNLNGVFEEYGDSSSYMGKFPSMI